MNEHEHKILFGKCSCTVREHIYFLNERTRTKPRSCSFGSFTTLHGIVTDFDLFDPICQWTLWYILRFHVIHPRLLSLMVTTSRAIKESKMASIAVNRCSWYYSQFCTIVDMGMGFAKSSSRLN
ncbi:hypothetical protein HanRHA438_Chr09g0379961 [Helianthus annuus]|nr:hypothetical protein HanRHA438_Chr09g0379961 [Helianthus annuus]